MTAPCYVVIGEQGAGKTTFGRALARALGTEATDTSAWLKRIEVRRNGGRPFTRADLVALGDALTAECPAILAAKAAESGRVIVGVRRKAELAAFVERWPNTIVVYVMRPAGPEVSADNFELEPVHAHHVVAPPDEATALEMALEIAAYEEPG